MSLTLHLGVAELHLVVLRLERLVVGLEVAVLRLYSLVGCEQRPEEDMRREV